MQSLWMVVAGLAFALMGASDKYAAADFSAAELVFWRSLASMAASAALLARAGLGLATARFGVHVHRGVSGFVSLFHVLPRADAPARGDGNRAQRHLAAVRRRAVHAAGARAHPGTPVALPYLANQLGWIAAEVGRQPWVVYGLLRTSDAVSKVVVAEQVMGSIVMFVILYALLFAVWVFVMNDKIHKGPDEYVEPPEGGSTGGWWRSAGQRAGVGGQRLSNGGN